MTSTLLQQAVEAPAVHAAVREAGGIVHSDGNIFFTNAAKFMQAVSALQQQPEPVAEDPKWVLLSRPGMSAQRKGPFRDGRLVEQMLRDLYELYPDATCLVVDAPHTTYPEDGREWVAMFGDQRRKRIPPALQQQEEPREVVGWKLVPIEPTEEMLARGTEHFLEPHTPANNTLHVYRAMLYASPSPQDFTLPMVEEGKGTDGVKPCGRCDAPPGTPHASSCPDGVTEVPRD